MNGAERTHAVLSPSAAARWLACTPSARIEERLPDNAGEYAREGTLAHAFCELLLRRMQPLPVGEDDGEELERMRGDALYSREMEDHAKDYAAYVAARYAEARATTRDAALHVEERLDLSAYAPECFGTADAVIIADGLMDVIDYKYGKGVRVDARHNRQMMLYAIGAVERFGMLYDLRRVRMTIFQPRIGNVSQWELDVAVLMRWARAVLRPRARLAFRGEGEPSPGRHCRFCRAMGRCRALAERNMRAAPAEMKDAALMTDEETAAVLAAAPDLRAWIEAVERHALEEAIGGHRYPGFKLVEGRSVRRYTDEAEVARVLTEGGIAEESIWQPRALKTITAMEKMLTKKGFNALIGHLVEKPQGKPTLVPEDDRRPEWSSAAADFRDVAAAERQKEK